MIIVFGFLIGLISAFFGIGGGTILVPLLLFLGYDIKVAISISITQMAFSSVFGTILNLRRQVSILKYGLLIGSGGAIGGFLSSFIVVNLPEIVLKLAFSFILVLAIVLVSIDIKEQEETKTNIFILFFVGLFVGVISLTIGVGGSIIITPFVLLYLKKNLKFATSIGLFFVVFSSLSGVIGLYFHNLLIKEGFIIGVSSLFGVYIGILLKDKIKLKNYKIILLFLYITLLILMLIKLNEI